MATALEPTTVEAMITQRLRDAVVNVRANVYYQRLPDKASFPAVQWQVISDPAVLSLGQQPVANARTTHIQVSLFAAFGEDIVRLTKLVKASLNGWNELGDGVRIGCAWVDTVTDTLWREPVPPAYGRVLDVYVQSREV